MVSIPHTPSPALGMGGEGGKHTCLPLLPLPGLLQWWLLTASPSLSLSLPLPPPPPADRWAIRVDNVLGQKVGHLGRDVVMHFAPLVDLGYLRLEVRERGGKGLPPPLVCDVADACHVLTTAPPRGTAPRRLLLEGMEFCHKRLFMMLMINRTDIKEGPLLVGGVVSPIRAYRQITDPCRDLTSDDDTYLYGGVMTGRPTAAATAVAVWPMSTPGRTCTCPRDCAHACACAGCGDGQQGQVQDPAGRALLWPA